MLLCLYNNNNLVISQFLKKGDFKMQKKQKKLTGSKKEELAVAKKEVLDVITVRRKDGKLVCVPISFFTSCSNKNKRLDRESVKRLAPGYQLIFVGCSNNEKSSYLKEEHERALKSLSKNQKYSFHAKGNKELNDVGVIVHYV